MRPWPTAHGWTRNLGSVENYLRIMLYVCLQKLNGKMRQKVRDCGLIRGGGNGIRIKQTLEKGKFFGQLRLGFIQILISLTTASIWRVMCGNGHIVYTSPILILKVMAERILKIKIIVLYEEALGLIQVDM